MLLVCPDCRTEMRYIPDEAVFKCYCSIWDEEAVFQFRDTFDNTVLEDIEDVPY